MRLHATGRPLVREPLELPEPGPHQVLLKVRACGVCRTDLHVVDGELLDQPLPIVPGHEIVGEIICRGAAVAWPAGARVGEEFLELAARIPVQTHVETFRLEAANDALDRLRNGRLSGAAVLIP